ncbi:hypothetical protein [Candidatus Amarobacter glycogenicus]|uniref:GHMP family kinase ATP-binding protein n=1 Tax=Candidatus Amarobacter glycogenicus TaxID=3140699 RepID=UPI002A14ECC8|nr:hypothetical protein [Dehalococcoidia bacterium]
MSRPPAPTSAPDSTASAWHWTCSHRSPSLFGDAEDPPTDDVGEKMVLTAIRQTYQHIGRAAPNGVRARYHVSIPLGRGLGASAVARVAGVVAVNEFERGAMDEGQMLDIASELEGHGDNACPALFGGMQGGVQAADGHYLRADCKYPQDAAMAILIPDHSMPTKEARKALPEQYSKADTVHNTGRAALFVAAMASGRNGTAGGSDRRSHPPAAGARPLPAAVRCLRCGAWRARARGLAERAGSSVAAICPEGQSREIAAAMLATAEAQGYSGRSLVTRIAREGATISKVELV